MAFSTEDAAKRAGKLTASRVACLMTGDAEAILRLYREMIGELEPEDLSDNWQVQLGIATETLQLNWYEKETGRVLEWRNRTIVHRGYDWAAATPDGWDRELQCPVEVKHCIGWEPVEAIIDRYQPQCHWQMWCTQTDRAVLSCIRGAAVPVIEYIDLHPPYMKDLIDRASHFVMCVAMRSPPVELPRIRPPIDPTRVVDMSLNNAWSDKAAIWLENRPMYQAYEAAKEDLKAMVPADARRVFGAGVQVTRAKNGALTVRTDT